MKNKILKIGKNCFCCGFSAKVKEQTKTCPKCGESALVSKKEVKNNNDTR